MPLTPSDNSQNDHVTDYLQSRDRRDSPEYSDHDEVMLAPEGAGSDFPEDDVPKEGNSLRRSDRGGVELPMTPTTASEDPAKPEEPDSVVRYSSVYYPTSQVFPGSLSRM
ncbi:hypothetical protein B0H17DRAFT_1093367 [Mycena rosella]|uniref:Uncharacterized protein n=1 Tax=Mycena rosella TaxID=1033263 RepID=A0AAD7CTH0_MYCRO|nr:hypothetical protein B0H17DRAFT_1093367 [Mycena rosella]